MCEMNLTFLLVILITTKLSHASYLASVGLNNATHKVVLSDIDYRLPDIYVVDKYDLLIYVTLNEDPKNSFTFSGTNNIDFKLKNDTHNITLHAENLKIKEDLVLKQNGHKTGEINYYTDPEKNFLIVKKKSESSTFTAGNYSLEINYSGKLSDDFRGFFKSSYIDNENMTVLAATHFEPTAARRAFPCFDEPKYKAKFLVSIQHHKKFVAVSNMKVMKQESDPDNTDRIFTRFEETPRISTYLLAFVVSNFQNVTNSAKNFTIFTKKNSLHQTTLAMKYSEPLLKALENVTKISLNITKMDQVALPKFAACAMENYGLIFYRENCLLHDEASSSSLDKYNVVNTISHEFAHQWFGNLVSPKWWQWMWLNKGFATFFSTYIIDKLEPSWRATEYSVVLLTQKLALYMDSLNETHAMNKKIENSDDITKFSIDVVYYKSAAVIRMMQHILSDPIFIKGLQNYLTKNLYNSTDSDDLFDVINETLYQENDKPSYNIKEVMNSWVNFEGYPVINVTRNYKDKMVELKQERFFTDITKDSSMNGQHSWHIPINYATPSKLNFDDTKPEMWLTKPSQTEQMSAESTEWIILNKKQTGFYRVNYDKQNWKLLIDYLKSEKRSRIDPINRAQLVNDGLFFAKQARLDLATFLDLIGSYKNDTDVVAWYPGLESLAWVEKKLSNSEYYLRFQKFALETTQKLIEKVGFAKNVSEDMIISMNRDRVVSSVCKLGHNECIETMKKQFSEWLKNLDTDVDPDLKQNILCYGLKQADFDEWEEVRKRTVNESMPDKERRILQTSLACSEDKNIIKTFLSHTLANDSKFELFITINDICDYSSHAGLDIVLDFVFDKFIHIYQKYKNDDIIRRLLNKIGENIKSEDTLKQFKQRSSSMNIPDNLKSESIAKAEKNILWMKKNEEQLIAWSRQINGVSSFSGSIVLISLLLFTILHLTGN